MRELYEAVAGEVEKVVVGQEQMTATAARRAARSAGTCCSRACPASPRRCSPRAPRARSASTSGACSSRPTCCRRTSPARSRCAAASSRSGAGRCSPNVLLADEINRTPPKTQAALLEAMQERQVSVEGTPQPLPDPFLVVATQNPIEYEGTYPLPEAQLDRFLVQARRRLPGGGRGGRDAPARSAAASAPGDLDACVRWSAPRRCAKRAPRSTPRASTTRSPATWSRSCAGRASCRASSSAPARAPRVHLLGAAQGGRPAGRARLRDARRRRAAWPPPCSRTGSCSPPRPSSSATGPTTRCAPRSARCRCRDERLAPRAAAILAGIALADALTSPAGRRDRRGRARRRGRGRRAGRPPRAGSAPRGAAAISRAASRRRCASSAARAARRRVRLRQPAPPDARRRPAARPTAGSTRRSRRAAAAATRSPRSRCAARARSASAAGATAPAGEHEVTSTPTCRRRGGSRSRCAQGRFRAAGRLTRGPARARHRVRVDPRLRARRRHPPGQLARHRAHAAADEQPVPRRAGPRGDAADRLRAPDGRAARRPHAARRGGRRRRRRRARRGRARRPRGVLAFDREVRRRARAAPRGRRRGRARRCFDLEPRAVDSRLRARVPDGRGRQARADDDLLRPARRERGEAARRRRAGAHPPPLRDRRDRPRSRPRRHHRHRARRAPTPSAPRPSRSTCSPPAPASRTCSGTPARRSSRRRPTSSPPPASPPTCGQRPEAAA